MITSILLFTLGIIMYSVKELYSFNKLKWSKDGASFWGFDSYIRKYKIKKGRELIEAQDNWYTRLFKITKKERWFTSTNFTVAFTDGFHMSQALAKIFICSSFYPLTNWWFPILLWCLWGIIWTLCDKYLTK